MKSELITLLETLKYPVFLQGSINSLEEYPESFFTFWNFETPESAFYDNDAGRAVWGFWVYFYSTDPTLVETQPEIRRFKIYYDCGQTPVTNMLRSTFKERSGLDIEFAQAVRPERYKLFQIADMIATLKLVELKIDHGDPMTESEYKFFGGVRNFKRNYLRFVKAKEM